MKRLIAAAAAAMLPLCAASEPQGLLSPALTNLPVDLWTRADVPRVRTVVDRLPGSALPSVAGLLRTVVLAQAEPPASGEDFLADRLIWLNRTAALEPAFAMSEVLTLDSASQVTQMADIALLTGQDAIACPVVLRRNDVSMDWGLRVFCLARSGDWEAAALTLDVAERLALIPADKAALLAVFLDPEVEGSPPDVQPVTPLVFRLREAVGAPLTTAALPLPFAHADLRASAGWKFRLDAAERLARHNALDANRLIHAYRGGRPAASGAVWDRARAVQAVDIALSGRDRAAQETALTAAWDVLAPAGLAASFGPLWGPLVAERSLGGDAARRFRLLSPSAGTDERDDVLGWVATGKGTAPADAPPAVRAVIAGLSGAPVPEHLMRSRTQNGLGQALIEALVLIESGRDGGDASLRDGLAFLRQAGRMNDARRIALDHLILDLGL